MNFSYCSSIDWDMASNSSSVT